MKIKDIYRFLNLNEIKLVYIGAYLFMLAVILFPNHLYVILNVTGWSMLTACVILGVKILHFQK